MNERSISVIEDYIENNLPVPTCYFVNHHFFERTYSRWAAYEILRRIINELFRLPTHITGRNQQTECEIIYEFIDEITCYSSIKKEDHFIFSTAKKTASDVLKLFL